VRGESEMMKLKELRKKRKLIVKTKS